MNIQVSQELQAFIDPLTPQEYQALEQSLLSEGCRDALVVWGTTLIDGHNRYAICQRHHIPFEIKQNTSFASIEDVMLWMIDNHLARRSVTDFQRGMLALRKKELVANKVQKKASDAQTQTMDAADTSEPTEVPPPARQSRKEVAEMAGISSNTVTQIDKIRRAATPELVEAVRSGTISINAAATIAALPSEEQIAAVAGGKKELQQAAKQVRELRSQHKTLNKPLSDALANSSTTIDSQQNHQQSEQQLIAALTAENHALKLKVEELTAALARTADTDNRST